jgi:phosphoribosylaminoimidazole (AIR) synthetase
MQCPLHYITISVVNSNEHYNAISVDIVAILVNSKVIVTVTTLLLVLLIVTDTTMLLLLKL